MAWSMCRRYLQNFCLKVMDNKHAKTAEILGNFGDIEDISLENLIYSILRKERRNWRFVPLSVLYNK